MLFSLIYTTKWYCVLIYPKDVLRNVLQFKLYHTVVPHRLGHNHVVWHLYDRGQSSTHLSSSWDRRRCQIDFLTPPMGYSRCLSNIRKLLLPCSWKHHKGFELSCVDEVDREHQLSDHSVFPWIPLTRYPSVISNLLKFSNIEHEVVRISQKPLQLVKIDFWWAKILLQCFARVSAVQSFYIWTPRNHVKRRWSTIPVPSVGKIKNVLCQNFFAGDLVGIRMRINKPCGILSCSVLVTADERMHRAGRRRRRGAARRKPPRAVA